MIGSLIDIIQIILKNKLFLKTDGDLNCQRGNPINFFGSSWIGVISGKNTIFHRYNSHGVG